MWRRMIDEDLELAREPVREVCQHIADSGGEDIDATHMQHVIAAAQDTEAKARSSTGAEPGPHDTHYVAGTIAHQGLGLLAKMSVHQLAFGPFNEGEGSSAVGFDQLHGHRSLCMEVQSLAVCAFRPHDAQHIRHPEVRIHGPHAPGLFHACPYARFTDPWLGPKEAFAQAQVTRIQPLGPGGFGQGEHIRWSGTDGVDPQLTNGLKQEGSLTHTEGRDGGSGGLQVLIIGETAHPEAIIEAMYHCIAGTQPGSPEGAGGTCIHEVTIAMR